MLAYILQGLGYGLAAAAQPGPFLTYALSQSLKRGWRRALPIALAPLISDGPIILLVLLALSQVPAWLQRLLYFAGGLFILYLAWGIYRSWRDYAPWDASQAPASEDSLLKAGLMNALSPGPYLYWSLVTGPILLAGWRESPALGLGLLLGFYVSMVGLLATLIVLFGTAQRLGARVNRAMLGVSALAMVGFGLYQLWRGLAA
ncbi:MAG: LysE family transporter [Chloroflexi bacterium]|nr:LysE family transporter [Chloroflexota bacterium]